MPPYYFQVQFAGANQRPIEDPLVLADLTAAWEEGVRTCGELLGEYGRRFTPDSDLSIQVQDQDRKTLGAITITGSMSLASSI